MCKGPKVRRGLGLWRTEFIYTAEDLARPGGDLGPRHKDGRSLWRVRSRIGGWSKSSLTAF